MPRRQSSRRYPESSKAEVNPSEEGQVQRPEAGVFGWPGKGLPLTTKTAAGGRGPLFLLRHFFQVLPAQGPTMVPYCLLQQTQVMGRTFQFWPQHAYQLSPSVCPPGLPAVSENTTANPRSPVLPGPVYLPEGHPTQSNAPPHAPKLLCQQHNLGSGCSL